MLSPLEEYWLPTDGVLLTLEEISSGGGSFPAGEELVRAISSTGIIWHVSGAVSSTSESDSDWSPETPSFNTGGAGLAMTGGWKAVFRLSS